MTNPIPDNASAPRSASDGRPDQGSARTTTPTLPRRHDQTWPDNAVDIDLPNDARVHDALLGGAYNFHADRAFAGQLAAAVPDLLHDLYAERHFMDRAIRACANAGIRQFIDLGAGMPSAGNVRAEVGRTARDARVLCVDLDPVVVELLTWMLRDDDQAAVVRADLRQPDDILHHPTTRTLLDLDQPSAVVAVNVLHLLDQPRTVIDRILQPLPPGSFLIASHLTADACPNDVATLAALTPATGIAWTARTRAEVEDQLFTGLTLVWPGVVYASRWRPDPGDDQMPNPRKGCIVTGVGRTPSVGVPHRRRTCEI